MIQKHLKKYSPQLNKKQSIPFTQKGFDELKTKLKDLYSKRPHTVQTLKRAREMGDLSENGLYKAAKQELGDLDRQIRHLEYLINSAKIFIPNDNKTVQIGHQVIVKAGNETREFFLVGQYEANPKEHKISNKSPMGFALMGRRINDDVNIKTPNSNLSYKIISIK